MHKALALSIALGAFGCSASVTRHVTATPIEAAELARTHVVVRDSETLTDAPRVVHEEATANRVVVDAEYKVGDEIPGEGVVRKDNDTKMWVAGVVMMVVGTGLAVGGWRWSVGSGNDNNDGALGGLLLALAGGVPLAGAGIILTIVGLVPRVFVEKKVGALHLAPVVGPRYGGAALELAF
jgi:hypothetical protein